MSTFERLLEKDNSVTIHLRNLIILATELYKSKEHLAAPVMHEIFEQRSIQYNLRSQTDFRLGSVKRVSCGLRALRYLGPKIWNIVPFEMYLILDVFINFDQFIYIYFFPGLNSPFLREV